jgi:hypothetical protein
MQVKRSPRHAARIVAVVGGYGWPAWHDRRDALRMTGPQAGMNDRPRLDGVRFPLVLLVVFLLAAAALGISPHYRQDWLIAAGARLRRRWSPPGADESVASADVQV